jgi:DUF4097 and DUF4098 domain-containing protein YvlB
MRKIFCFIIILLTVIAATAGGKSFRFDFQKNIEVGANAELTVSNSSGNIEITGAPVSEISISAIKNIRATDAEEAEEISGHIEIKVVKAKNRIAIQTNYIKALDGSRSFWEKLFGTGSDSYGSVDYTITVPSDCYVEVENLSGDIIVSGLNSNLDLSATSGNINIQDIKGTIDIETTSGDMEIDNITGDTHISATSSNVVINSITGAINLNSTSGETRGTSILGPIAIAQTSGDINLRKVSGDLRIKSTSGDIDVDQDSGAVDIQTQSGNVGIKSAMDTRNDSFIETISGCIIFSVPSSASGSVRLETISGDINTELALTLKTISKNKLAGYFGQGGPEITLTTASGDITIGQY